MKYSAAHWGVMEFTSEGGLTALSTDPARSGIGLDQLSPELESMRVRKPAVRKSFLEHGALNAGGERGREPFIEVEWDVALDLAAAELRRVKEEYGNQTIFGGSYGWASAGRFHHAQSQLHRFLNCLGGYVRHVGSYSLGAGFTVLPHIAGTFDELIGEHTTMDVVAEHTKLFVAFGGIPLKNAQISAGGAVRHDLKDRLAKATRNGARFINISPVRDNIDVGGSTEWIPIRPGSDVALMLALAYVLETHGLADRGFLSRNCQGYEKFSAYLLGEADGIRKTPRWAAALSGVPASRIESLAVEMAGARTLVNCAWSLQRALHGEQTFWMTITLAAMLGQIGLPGGGFGLGYGAMNSVGSEFFDLSGPTFPQGSNGVKDFIPVARIADMLLNPGQPFPYNGQTHHYPDIRLIYWAGGNPFHHHQDLNRLIQAWKKPQTIIVNEQFWTASARFADIVFPATLSIERADISYSRRESAMIWSEKVADPLGQARDDYDILRGLALRLGFDSEFSKLQDAQAWLSEIYLGSLEKAARQGVNLPSFDEFRDRGIFELGMLKRSKSMLDAFRNDPAAHPLRTPSGKVEIYSETIAAMQLSDCAGHPTWFEPDEWLGTSAADGLHLISDQPARRLHSQLDAGPFSRAGKVAGREPVYINPVDAKDRQIVAGDLVELYNERGRCLAGAIVSDDIMQGVVRLATGAWFDPDWSTGLEKAGNPNVLTADRAASSLSQGCAAQSCIVRLRRLEFAPPEITAYSPPEFALR